MSHIPNPLDEIRHHERLLQQALDAWDMLPHEERIARLKESGILDEDGQLAARYRDEDEPEAARPTRSAG